MIIAALGLSDTGLAAALLHQHQEKNQKLLQPELHEVFFVLFFSIFISSSSVTQLRVVNKMVK